MNALVQRRTGEETRLALQSLARTQFRLAVRYEREAREAEETANHTRYAYCKTEARRLWKEAEWHRTKARTW